VGSNTEIDDESWPGFFHRELQVVKSASFDLSMNYGKAGACGGHG